MAEQPIDRLGAARSPSGRRSVLRASLGVGAAAFMTNRAIPARSEEAFPPGDPEWSQWRGSETGYSWSRVDVAGSGDGTLRFSGAVRDGSMCWRSSKAARERP